MYDTEVENNTILQYTCLDASIAMQPIIRRFRSVVITSGYPFSMPELRSASVSCPGLLL
jgi:hypothetical protein